MLDRNNEKIKEGNSVFFRINKYTWKGITISINEEKEIATFKVTERETGVGMIERLNFIECNTCVTIIK